MAKSTRQAVPFDDRFLKPITSVLDAGSRSSDGGALLLGGLDRELDLTTRSAA